ncbi:SDR family oxidoreductase [Kutzneria viridogrisea]|uniref:NAD(P)-dependent dehydrogenase (Short-subunit alcohol dehydrogenase family) n=1 Tax=Kutzneria viridogrisea TaxID=47990 RepID=A0ABR6B833_9PSEU|nr:NAD(P)-dependent dehydrogenase (short-subunit alcohol dehydrogenase family) [Kutzneria viridogrisea]
MELHGQRVVVLGGTSGIGLATARAAAERGADVVVASSRRTSVDKALAELPSGSTGHVADLSEPAAIEALFAQLDPIDHLVYTAGESLELRTLAELDLDAAKSFFTVRYFGALASVRAAAPRLRPGGSITLTTGVAKDRPRAGWALGASVCGAVEALTRALAVELAPLRVNAVSPGVVRTELWAAMDPAARERMYAEVGAAIPAGRVGEVADIAQAYLYCLTQSFATGTVLTTDGGTVLV